jgi:hypothetical protein
MNAAQKNQLWAYLQFLGQQQGLVVSVRSDHGGVICGERLTAIHCQPVQRDLGLEWARYERRVLSEFNCQNKVEISLIPNS